jgi:hypothetical protein
MLSIVGDKVWLVEYRGEDGAWYFSPRVFSTPEEATRAFADYSHPHRVSQFNRDRSPSEKKPFKCPVCEGMGAQAISGGQSSTNPFSQTCYPRQGTGIVWGGEK